MLNNIWNMQLFSDSHPRESVCTCSRGCAICMVARFLYFIRIDVYDMFYFAIWDISLHRGLCFDWHWSLIIKYRADKGNSHVRQRLVGYGFIHAETKRCHFINKIIISNYITIYFLYQIHLSVWAHTTHSYENQFLGERRFNEYQN